MWLKKRTVLILLISALLLGGQKTEALGITGNFIVGTEGNDFISDGTLDGDYYDLLSGNDMVLENGGNDTYVGGLGNDFFVDISGDDTYLFNLGDGNDTIYDFIGYDTVDFGTGINDTDLVLSKDADGLNIGLKGTQDSIRIFGWNNNDYKIETIRFTDGSALTSSDLDLLYDGTLLLGTNSNDTITGNDLNNIIRAKAGDDVIDGGLAADVLYGGIGNDVYYVDNVGDAVVEYLNEGIDTVYASVSYQLGANVESLTLTGTADAAAVGNERNNTINGNVGNNTVAGGQGNDAIADAAGNDIYLFNLGDGQDTLTDLAGTDSIKFGAGITLSSLTYTQAANDLLVSINNTTDKITIRGWYASAANKIEKLEFADGSYVTADDIDNPSANLPTANAGPDQTVSRNAPVILDGSASADPQGGDLTYAWSLTSKPAGSAAVLTGADSATPTFTPDLPGNYEVMLVVTNDAGVASAPDTVVYSTVNSAPVADAGPDKPLLREGETIWLDGSQSWDDDGDPLTYAWSFTARPDGSTATLQNATTANPSFVADRRGTYTALLTVRDSFGGSSSDSVTISFENVRPVADAGNNDIVALGGTVALDGGGSVDANGDQLTYAWNLAERPPGSTATLEDPAAVAPRFRADRYGDYRVSLTVSDGELTSEPSAVTISCLRQDGDAERFLVTAIDIVNLMDEGEFKNASMRNTLTQKLTVILKQVAQGQMAEAVQKLREDVLAKTDGCAGGGAADKNDWITGCAAQRDLVPLLQTVLDILQP